MHRTVFHGTWTTVYDADAVSTFSGELYLSRPASLGLSIDTNNNFIYIKNKKITSVGSYGSVFTFGKLTANSASLSPTTFATSFGYVEVETINQILSRNIK